jgi:hypothetical protein
MCEVRQRGEAVVRQVEVGDCITAQQIGKRRSRVRNAVASDRQRTSTIIARLTSC